MMRNFASSFAFNFPTILFFRIIEAEIEKIKNFIQLIFIDENLYFLMELNSFMAIKNDKTFNLSLFGIVILCIYLKHYIV
jgi:hypothetical protein